MQMEYLSTLRSKVRTFIDENSISLDNFKSIDAGKVISSVKDESSSAEIALVSFPRQLST